MPTNCPSDRELLAFHVGSLEEERIDSIADHLEGCPRCEAAVERLDGSVDRAFFALRDVGPVLPVSVRGRSPGSQVPSAHRRNDGDLTAPENWPIIPGYEILGPLGGGGMGVVYRARHVRLNREVALKRLRADGSRELARSRAEAENLARLRHPNIVQIHEIVELEGQVFLALELVEGGALATRLSGKPQPQREVALLLEIVARAVHFAHRHGIVHRDLKPANILLHSTDDRVLFPPGERGLTPDSLLRHSTLVPKVADFGVAKRMVDGAGETRDGELIGTPSYMSPEQASGKLELIGPATDIYSLGVILYEMVTGRVPIQGTNTLDTLSLVLSEEPVSPRRLQPRLARDLETICLKCLEKQPARRYSSAADLADDLRRFLDDQPVRARPPSALYRFGKFARRNKTLLGGVIGVIGSLVTGLAVSLFFAFGEAHQRRLAEQNATRADEARLFADEERRMALREAYRGRIAAASSAILSHDVPEASRHLAAVPEQLREWEWRHLNSRLDESTVLIQPPDGERIWLVPALKGIWLYSGHQSTSRLMSESGRVRQVYPVVAYRPIHVGPTLEETRLEHGEGTVTVITDGTGKELFRLPTVYALAMSPDSTRVVLVAGTRTDRFTLVEGATGKELRTFDGHGGFVYSLVFSPDGKRIASASEDGTARIWSVATGKEIAVLRGHAAKVYCIAFRPDGARVLTTSADGTVRQWNPETGEPTEPPYTQHTGEVNVGVYSPDGQLIASGGTDRTVRLWSAAGRTNMAVRHGHTGAVGQLAFSMDGRRLASRGADGSVRIWDVDPRHTFPVLTGHTSYVYPVAFSPDGRWIASGSWDKTVRLWDARTGEVRGVWKHPSLVIDLAFSRDGSQLVSACGAEAIVRVWDVATGQMRRELNGSPNDRILALAANPAGNGVALAYGSGKVSILDVSTGEPLDSFQVGHGDALQPGGRGKCGYSPDGRLLAVAGQDSIVYLRDTRTSTFAGRLVGHTHSPDSMAFSRDGHRIFSAGHDRTIRVWDDDTRKCEAVLTGHPDEIFAVAIHPDGTRLASAGRDGIIWLWDVATGTEIARLRGHTNYIWSLAFSPDGKSLASGSGDGTVRLWDTQPVSKLYQPLRESEAQRTKSPRMSRLTSPATAE
jgi:WD40 repeat protein/serine/threonine protein kinase